MIQQTERVISKEELEELEIKEQEHIDELLDNLNHHPECIYQIDWVKETNGFDGDTISMLLNGIGSESILNCAIDVLKVEWDKVVIQGNPVAYLDPPCCDIIKWGGPERPVRFSTFLDEFKKAWILEHVYDDEKEDVYNNDKGFTKGQLFTMLYYVAKQTESENLPTNKAIAEIVSRIGAYKFTSVYQSMKGKSSFPKTPDRKYVAKILRDAFPHLANTIWPEQK
jgi:hypothetical protein